MRHRIDLLWALAWPFLLLSGCGEPAPDSLTLEILPPTDGAAAHAVAQDGENVLMVRVNNRGGSGNRVDLSLSAPEGVTAVFDSDATSSLWLEPGEARDVAVRIGVVNDYPRGDLDLQVTAEARSALGITDIAARLATADARLIVRGPDCSDFTTSVSPQNIAAVPGGSGTAVVSINRRTGFIGPVHLELLGVDSIILAYGRFDENPTFASYTTLRYWVMDSARRGARKKFMVRASGWQEETWSECSATFQVYILGFPMWPR